MEEVDSIHQEELTEVLRQRDEIKNELTRQSVSDQTSPSQHIQLIDENAALKLQLENLKDQSKNNSSTASNASLTPPRKRVSLRKN